MGTQQETLTIQQLLQFYEQAVQPKIDEALRIVREERELNQVRSLQSHGVLMDLRKDVNAFRSDMTGMEAGLHNEIRRLHDASSQDFAAFSDDVLQLKRRVARLEKKIA